MRHAYQDEAGLEPWVWPEVADLPGLPLADRPRHGASAHPSSGGGPSPVQRYGVPATDVLGIASPDARPDRSWGPVLGAFGAVVSGASWIAAVHVTGSSMNFLVVTVGLLVGLGVRLGGGPLEINTFFTALWSLLGATVGLVASGVQVEMARLGVGPGAAIAGSRWNDIVTHALTSPLNVGFVAAAVALGLIVTRVRAS